MLTILNNYAHGYVAIPVILACKTHGLFKILKGSPPIPFTGLVKGLKANSGHLRTALHMLESLNWVSRDSKDQYRLTPGAEIHREIPADIMELMSFPMKDYLNQNQDKHSLKRWIEMSSQRWNLGDPLMAYFLDGMLAIPLLLALKENHLLDNPGHQKTPWFAKLKPAVREEITAFFIHRGWWSPGKGGAGFTDTGRFMVERIFITAAVASYRPMLANLAEVIFGDCKTVFERDFSGSEGHVDRTLNVIASGFQHEKYFSAVEEIILSLFNREPYGEQPKYIADMGCGDGTFLKKIYEIIKHRSLRGSVLHRYPVKLIGIDFNEKALQETVRTLKDLDHLVLKGDIGDPRQMIEDLKENGIRDTENILHVRSFLDHDRPYIPPTKTSAANDPAKIPAGGVYVDREGKAIPAASVRQSLVEHLQRWSSILGRHGLIMLEVHCLEPKTVSEFLDRCESLHFDAYHRFSQQLLVTADSFLMAAAEAGLVPNPHFSRKFPKTLPFSRITLNYFEKSPGTLRQPKGEEMVRYIEEYIKTYPIDPRENAIYPESRLEAFGARWLLKIFQDLGIMKTPKESYNMNGLIRQLGILPQYERLFEALVRILERKRLLSVKNKQIRVNKKVETFALQDPEAEGKTFEKNFSRKYPDFMPFLNLMSCCLRKFADVLTGKLEANDVVFPGGSMEIFSGIFFGNSTADYFNRLVAEVIFKKIQIQQSASPQARVRILEIGAGTGGTTRFVLEKTRDYHGKVTFYYTDISSSFTRYGKKTFGKHYSSVNFERLNIEEDPASQGFELKSMDIIYACNVLHDTKYLTNTLHQVKRLLKSGGLLVLNEFTRMKDLLYYTGGLLHGWWLYQDPGYRLENTCLLSVEKWRSILEMSGFEHFHAFGLPYQTESSRYRQSVMTCELPSLAGETVPLDTGKIASGNDKAALPDPGDREPAENPGKREWITGVIIQSLEEILGEKRMQDFLPGSPFMELGLDSLELLELRTLLSKKLGIDLDAPFLFQYNTLEKILRYMETQPLRSKEKETAVPLEAGPRRETGEINRKQKKKGDIAIVGMAFRFPGGIRTKEDFWTLLKEGKSAVGPMPEERWQWPSQVDIKREKAYLAQGGFLPGIDRFDASFFRISAKEAELMDPQQRMLLELSWEVMEDAGYKPSGLGGSETGVYVGACHFEYRKLLEENETLVEAHLTTGTNGSILANRLSYFYDFHGPSMLVDTACSSSLAAIHEAVRALRQGECAQALVGGVNLICNPVNTLAYDHAGMLSREGRCRTFDAGANGFVRGEGGAMIFLKDLERARRDQDTIYAVIKGSAVNHGGQAGSLTAPNPEAQARLIAAALEDAEVPPGTISCVEAHGTGTSLGDPIEVKGLSQVFTAPSKGKQQGKFCGLGSVKANLGHLEGAAGIAGLIKVVLSMRNQTLPMTINYQTLNPEIHLGSALYIVEKTAAWQRLVDENGNEVPRRAGVSAFGFGGANAHVILEEYVEPEPVKDDGTHGPHIVVFSAKTQDGLERSAGRFLDFLNLKKKQAQLPGLREMAYTLQVGREAMKMRLALVVPGLEELVRKLETFCAGEKEIPQVYQGPGGNDTRNIVISREGGSAEALLEASIREKEYGKLAQLWVSGLPFNWHLLYPNPRPRRICLPTYPFSGECYWVPGRALPGDTGTLILRPCWQEQAVSREAAAPVYTRHLVMRCEPEERWKLGSWEVGRLGNKEEGLAPPLKMMDLHSPQEEIGQRYQDYALRVFSEIRSILADKPVGKVLVQVVAANRGEQQLFPGLAGLLKTAHLENPKLLGQLIEVTPGEDPEGIAAILEENSRCPLDTRIRYQEGKRWVAGWTEVEASRQEAALPWKDRGIYLLSGGAGGLGLIFAREIARQVKNTTLILIGRSRPGPDKQVQIKELQGLGSGTRIEYRQVDVTQKQAVVSLIRDIREKFGDLHGIIHSAGVIRDSVILKKTSDQLLEVLAPKVTGLVNLDQASKDLGLDFFLLFSSLAGSLGNPGQAGYSAANAFMDAYAGYRNSLRALKQRQGQTLSIAWPLWKEGGMQVDEETREAMRQRLGIIPMQTPTGIRALYRGLVPGQDQVMVLEGNLARIKQKLLPLTSPTTAKPGEVPAAPGSRIGNDTHRLVEKVEAALLRIAAGLLKVETDDIDANAPLEEYGFDPVTLSEFTGILLREYRLELTPALFFEHRTLQGAAAYLVKEHREVFAGRFPTGTPATPPGVFIPPVDPGLLKEKTLHRLKILVGEVIKRDAHRIDANEPLGTYGIDSLIISQLNRKLAGIFAELSKTLFYEYQTLEALAGYFIADYPQECLQWTGPGDGLPAMPEAASPGRQPAPTGDPGIPNPGTRAGEPIAIIGISARFPGAKNLEEYWENLKAGKSYITEIPRHRWDWKDYYHQDPGKAALLKKSYGKWGAFLDEFDLFDPLFFNLTPREAENIDPQERLFLEECWKALEDAGYAPSKLSPSLRQGTGVFGGITKQGFNLYGLETGHHFPATSFSSLVNRVSYSLNLQGPSIPLDTMCSSSLAAIHEACEYLRHGTGEMAIAGGVNLYLHPATYIGLSINQVISSTSTGAAFGKDGTGFVPGEGVGVIVLKPYDRALKDGDGIYALIRGTAVNHDGKTNGYTTPNPHQQAAVIRQALQQNNLDPRTIGYIEAAANGSEMGDAIEMTALTKVFSRGNGAQGDYKIGSVKPNIGHCEAASGMSQIIKVILALIHKTLVPTLLKGELNPNINFRQLPFRLQQDVSAWKPLRVDGSEVPRRAGITGVGAGGVNAHIIVEEYIPAAKTPLPLRNEIEPVLFVISAKNRDRLRDYAGKWSLYLQKNPGLDLESTAYTLQRGREEMPCRLAIVTANQRELVHRLQQCNEGQENAAGCYPGNSKHNKFAPPGEITQVIKARDLHHLAELWVEGNSIPWDELYPGRKPLRTTGLPTYPFTRRRCWLSGDQTQQSEEKDNMTPVDRDYENKAAEFYTFWAGGSKKEFHEEYLTFCPFTERVPGFSMSRLYLNPGKFSAEMELMKAKQIELRQVLFCKVDFNRLRQFLDIGCGHGTDVIQIAALYPHIQTYGFTITKAQANLGNQRIAEMGLNSRAQIFHKDSSKDAFPRGCDLIIGIEVTFHIRDKHGLFHNIASALNPGGNVLLMDYIANLRGPIVDPNVEISVPTGPEWLDILSRHQLVIDEIIDVSPGIANFLYDPEIEQNIKTLPKVARDSFRSYANQSISLQKGWISYCLLKLKKDTRRSEPELRDANAGKIAGKTPYPEALAEMFNRGHIPYPKNGKPLTGTIPHDAASHRETGWGDHLESPRTLRAESRELSDISGSLTDIFVTVLGLHRLELEEAATFNELGINSVNAVELLEAINTRFDLNLPTSVVFEYNDRDSLAKYIGLHLQTPQTKQRTHSTPGTHTPPPPANQITPRAKADPVENEDRYLDRKTGPGADDIAIIGLSCRCAGANGQQEFWELVSQGKNTTREIKDKHWLDFFKANSTLKVPGRYGAMEDIDAFDPLFFNISPREAGLMDVSQRILLEECYKALEDSGYAPSLLRERPVGTFIGTMGITPRLEDFTHFSMLGTDTSILASRIAYFLNLKGPALAINTACSSSLVAIDTACQKLKSRDIDLAITGGITIYTHPAVFIQMNNAGMLSPAGECRPFDNGADGIVVGDGVGIVILKRFAEAQRDNDYIYGIIRGSGTNQDGQTSGITVPSFLSQSQLQESIYRKNQICVEDLQYLETHGTGTKLGDPIEIHALGHSFEKFTSGKRFCAVGALKANIGHPTAAAGVMGVIKVLLSLKHKQIPPSINFNKENEHIDFKNSPFFVNTSLTDWPVNSKGSRLAAVSSFGFSGTNAHLVIEEYGGNSQPPAARSRESIPGLLVLSAKSQEGLRSYAQKTGEFIRAQKEINLADLVYTFQVGRESMPYRLALTASSKEKLLEQLEQFAAGDLAASGDIHVGKTGEKGGIRIGDIEEGKEFIQTLVRRNKIKKLAELWVNGDSIDWGALYRGVGVKRLAGLPTYPFARERCSVPGPGVKAAGSIPARSRAMAGPGVEDPPVQRTPCFLTKHWEPAPCSTTPGSRRHRTIALLTTPETESLAAELSRHFPGSQILLLHDPGNQLRQPEHPWKNVDGFVDLTGCGRDKTESLDWLVWLRHLIEHGHREGLTILGVTKGLESYRNSAVNLSGASCSGLYRMLQWEYSHLRSRHMDADPGGDDKTLARQIAAEFFMDSRDPEVCYREGKRCRAYLREIPAGIEENSKQARVFPPGHVLWITGGTRGLGYLCARHFITHYGVKRLVLTGREVIPPREQWDSAGQQNTAVAEKIRALRALEAQGAEVRVLALALTDEPAVQQGLQEVKGAMGPIGGILHCAGLGDFDNPAFIRKSIAGIQQVLDPKVRGLDLLVQTFKNEPLQFFILFSSVSAIIPGLGPGHSDYVMANAYMDYAAEANLHACPMVSIQWPGWKETGMGEPKSKAYRQTGLLSLTDTEGLRLLDEILARKPGPVVLPAVMDPALWKPRQLMSSTPEEVSTTPGRAPRPGALEPLPTPHTLESAIQTWLISLFSRELQIEPSRLELDKSFQDYGVDSILLTQLWRNINRRLTPANRLDPSILYEYSSLGSLAAWLARTQASSFAEAPAASTPAADDPAPQGLMSPPPGPSISSPGREPPRGLSWGPGSENVARPSDIAVIGLSCRFPGAGNLAEYWRLLSEGHSAIGPVPPGRWGNSSHFYAGLLPDLTHFDAKFFLVPGNDARAMDPQALLALEESLKLFYHAGYSHHEIKGKPVGVFLGARSQHRPDPSSLRGARNPVLAVGQNYLAANISQFFDLHGPALVLDTACSSALVGMNLAIQALHGGEIDSALVGGMSLLNTDETHRMFQQRGILSPGPSFHVFDRRAGGVVLGEGVGMVLLKPLAQALEDGDHIYAVIKACAINNDGRTAGPATPNLQAQKDVLQRALMKSGKKPGEISYIEANGSGSQVTDLLELKAIQSVYRSAAGAAAPCGLGSMKPNIGHPLYAEGIAGFIKVVLMLRHRQLVPFLSGQQHLEYYDMESSPFYFCRRLTEWTTPSRVAAINCFADGGTNAHVILEGWEEPAPGQAKRNPLPPPELDPQPLRQEDVSIPANKMASPGLRFNEPAVEQMVWDTFK